MGLDRSRLESGDILEGGRIDIAPGPWDGAAGGSQSWSLLPHELGGKSFPKE